MDYVAVLEKLEAFGELLNRQNESTFESTAQAKALENEVYLKYGELEDVFDKLLGDSKIAVPGVRGAPDSIHKNYIEAGYLSGRTFYTHQGYAELQKVIGKVRSLSNTSHKRNSTMSGIDVFISHSSQDEEMARRLITLIKAALRLPSDKIRCTSVDGYRLPAGAPIVQLRTEIHATKAFVALITPSSINSAFVLFELGARWGTEKPLLPLLACGAETKHLRGPLTEINALHCNEQGQLLQFIDDLAGFLEVIREKPAAYTHEIAQVINESKRPSQPESTALVRNIPHLVLNGDCYFDSDGDGPFCTTCWDSNTKRIRLKEEIVDFQQITGLKWKCPVCHSRHKGGR